MKVTFDGLKFHSPARALSTDERKLPMSISDDMQKKSTVMVAEATVAAYTAFAAPCMCSWAKAMPLRMPCPGTGLTPVMSCTLAAVAPSAAAP